MTPTDPTNTATISPDQILGTKPWFPWPLSRWRWLTEPIRAERLAALRIGLASLMLLELLVSLFPISGSFLHPDRLWMPRLYPDHLGDWNLRWSLLSGVESVAELRLALVLSAAALICLLIGFLTRISAILSWILAVSVTNVLEPVTNAGDSVKMIFLLYLMLSPCGAAWSLDSWWRRRYRWRCERWRIGLQARMPPVRGAFYVHPWPVRLILFQLCVAYFFNGLFKANGNDWWRGDSLYYVLGDVTLTRTSFQQLHFSIWLLRCTSFFIMLWELFFPVVMMVPWKCLSTRMRRSRLRLLRMLGYVLRWNREAALLFGVAFHLGIATFLELGFFSSYVLCGYLPLLPWERIGIQRHQPGDTLE